MRFFPKNLKQVKNRLKRYTFVPLSKRKDNELYLNTNKSYKNIDWRKSSISISEAKEIFQDNHFHKYKWLIQNNRINKVSEGVTTSSAAAEMFKREVAMQIDQDYWRRNRYAHRKHRMKYGKSKKYFMRAPNGERVFLGTHPESIQKRFDLIINYLQKRPFLFDESNQFYLKKSHLRNMIRQHLLTGNIEDFDLIDYLKNTIFH